MPKGILEVLLAGGSL